MARYLDLEQVPEEEAFIDDGQQVNTHGRHGVARTGAVLGSVGVVACGAFLLLARSTATLSKVDEAAAVGLGASWEDKGYGKCLLEAGGDPEHDWLGSGDLKKICDADATCTGYSPSRYGGGLTWHSGPLKGGGAAWGGCHCISKVTAAPGPTPPPPTLPPPPTTSREPQEIEVEAAADEAGAKAFPNVHLIASGYNIFYADPMPKIDRAGGSKVGMDPGLRKPVFSIEYNEHRLTGDRRHKRPDGYFATIDYGCSEVFSTKTISDKYEFTSERNMEASISGQAGLDIDIPPTSDQFSFSHGDNGIQDTGGGPMSLGAFVGGSGTLSGSYKTMKKDDIFQNNRLVISNAKCAVYTAGIAYGFPPKTHPDFKAAVDAAGSKGDWHNIFDNYGTHYMSNVKMGARFGSQMVFGKSHYDAMTNTMMEAGVEVGPVIEAGVKMAVSMPEIEDALSVEWSPKIAIQSPVLEQKEVKKLNSFASSHTFQGVGPAMPPGGASKWMEQVEKNPVPLRFSKLEICAHPGLDLDERKACAEALSTYCKDHLESKGADCNPSVKRQCQLDDDCAQGKVCREFVCQKVPVCYVSVYSSTGQGGHEYTLDPVNAVDNPDGKPTSLKTDNWHDKVESFKLGKGCKKVKLYDDDPGNVFEGAVNNKEFTSSQGSLERDLHHDVWQVWVWANDVPGTAPFNPGEGQDPGHVGSPNRFDFKPEEDAMFAEPPKEGSGLSHLAGEEYFPNIGKAMYGYNHFHGAPFSTKYAGTDPGFQGRGVWKMTYDKGSVGSEATWHRLPMAPQARYFVVFASKHPQVDKLQEDAKNPQAAGIKELTDSLAELKTKLEKYKDKSLDFYNFKRFRENSEYAREQYTTTQLPFAPVTDQYCGLVMDITKTIAEIDGLQETTFKKDYDKYYEDMRGSYGRRWRRLTAWAAVTHEDRWKEVGDIFCEGGKAREWNAENAKVAKELHDAQIAKWSGGYGRRWRRLQENVTAERRLRAEHTDWYSADKKPNIREFGSLAKAKQALRAETTCIGSFDGEECPSGADYNLDVRGTIWDFAKYTGFDHRFGYVDPKQEMANKLKAHWPRFVVKIQNDEVAGIEEIDAQDQTLLWRTGFSTVFPDASARDKMVNFLKEHVKANPGSTETIGDESAVETKVPDGWKITRAKGGGFCEQDMKTDTVSDAYSYDKMTSSSFGIPKTSAYVKGNGFSFGLSYEKKEAMKQNGQKGEKMYSSQAECGTYYAELVDLENHPPETEPSLAFLAGKAKKVSDFWIIFDQYGLHFPTEMVFGARYGTSQYIKESSFQEYQSEEESLSLDFGVQAAIPTQVPGVDLQASRDVSIGYSGTESEAHSTEKYFEERRTFSIGKRLPAEGIDEWMKDISGEDMPIKFSLAPICDHPVFKAEKATCTQASGSYCKDHLRRNHPDLSCGASEKTECTWDTDCIHPHSVCNKVGMCSQKPSCLVTLYSGGNYDGDHKEIGPAFYDDHAPYQIIDLENLGYHNWKGKARSMKISGGCAKVVKMSSAALNSGDNFAKTNHKSNKETNINGISNCNYVALFPKEHFVDEDSEWFQSKR